MPRGRQKGFHHSEETKAKMRGKRKTKKSKPEVSTENNEPELIDVSAQ